MELVAFGKEIVHSVAEKAASYKLGQSVLRQADRALWLVEKCSKWSVPVDQDEHPQPELVRPLPWLLFLPMLLLLRVTRETISLARLALGKPPLRSVDVVTFIQSKRRYLRALKYQGSRAMRSRSAAPHQPWYKGVLALLEFTMCFRNSHAYGNNNTTQISNNDEVVVVKRPKRGRSSSGGGSSESTMDQLITRMLADLDADSDDDSSYTLTNATSENSLNTVESEHEHEIVPNGASTPTASPPAATPDNSFEGNFTNVNNVTITNVTEDQNGTAGQSEHTNSTGNENTNNGKKGFMSMSQTEDLSIIKKSYGSDATFDTKQGESMALIKSERKNHDGEQSPKKDPKIGNGRAISRVPKKSKGELSERRESEVPLVKITASESS